MKQKLEPAEESLFQLKDDYARAIQSEVFKACQGPVRFMLAGESGANREYFLKFQEDFPKAKILHLNKNYRSTQLILDASGRVIARSPDRQPSNLWCELIDPTELEIYQAPTQKAEASIQVKPSNY